MKIELTAEQARIATEALEHWAESIRDTIGEVDEEERAGMLEEHDLAAGAMRAISAQLSE